MTDEPEPYSFLFYFFIFLKTEPHYVVLTGLRCIFDIYIKKKYIRYISYIPNVT